jgi:hypothetical protein
LIQSGDRILNTMSEKSQAAEEFLTSLGVKIEKCSCNKLWYARLPQIPIWLWNRHGNLDSRRSRGSCCRIDGNFSWKK